MLTLGENDLLADFVDSLKSRYSNRVKEIKRILDVLNIKSDCFHENEVIQNCIDVLSRNGAVNVDRLCLLCMHTKNMLEHTAKVDLLKKLHLMIKDLFLLLHNCSNISRQFRSDTRHYKSTVGMLATFTEEGNPKDEQDTLEQLENCCIPSAHSKVLQLQQKINLIRTEIEKLQTCVSKYEDLPPDLNLAKKLVEEKKIKLDKISYDIECESANSICDSSLSSSFI